MARPPRPATFENLIAEQARRIAALERREAYASKRAWIAGAGGLNALPVPIATPDSFGWLTVTTSYTDMACFVGGPFGQMWVLLAANGVPDALTARVTYPAGSGRVLGTSTFLEYHPTLGPVHLVQTAPDALLAAGTRPYDLTVTLQAITTDAATTNKIRVIGAGWGSSNV